MPTLARGAALVGTILVLCACSSRGFPPFWEHETGLPGNLREDRAVFGLISKTRGEDGALLSAVRPFMAKVEDGKGALKAHYVPPFGAHVENESGERTSVFPLFSDTEFGDDEDRRKLAAADTLTDQIVAPAYSALDDAGAKALVTGLERFEAAVSG